MYFNNPTIKTTLFSLDIISVIIQTHWPPGTCMQFGGLWLLCHSPPHRPLLAGTLCGAMAVDWRKVLSETLFLVAWIYVFKAICNKWNTAVIIRKFWQKSFPLLPMLLLHICVLHNGLIPCNLGIMYNTIYCNYLHWISYRIVCLIALYL